MRWSYKLCRIFGIDIKIHITFIILPLLQWRQGYSEGGLTGGLINVGLICLVFCIVLLHELGHSVMAKWYGVGVRDITLLPIGGMARMERIPKDPWAELAISLAGPAVNVAFLILIVPLTVLLFGMEAIFSMDLSTNSLPIYILGIVGWVNFVLLFFNVLPIFPMDGGRVLRAILAMRMPYVKATIKAANIGKYAAIAVSILAIAILQSVMIPIIMLFLYRMGQAEKRMVLAQSNPEQTFSIFGAPSSDSRHADYTYDGAEFYEPDPDRDPD